MASEEECKAALMDAVGPALPEDCDEAVLEYIISLLSDPSAFDGEEELMEVRYIYHYSVTPTHMNFAKEPAVVTKHASPFFSLRGYHVLSSTLSPPHD